MLIGIDFDNTIVCYDELFHKVARERNLIPADLPVNKSEVRNFLRRAGKEDIWTEMQGYVYGGRMAEALPYPGVIEFFKACRAANVEVCIVSHKTRYPFLGEKYDLHQAAKNWLELQGFFDPDRIGLKRENAFFELTKAEKLQRIGSCNCTHFIDDLPEILSEHAFPPETMKILFDSADIYAEQKFQRFQNWSQIALFFGLGGDSALRKKAASLLKDNGVAPSATYSLLRGGGNNRVYRVSDGKSTFALKEYFQNPGDPRDRFNAEKGFYDYLSEFNIAGAAQRIGWDIENRLGLFEYIKGRKLGAEEINAEHVATAAAFISALNQHRGSASAKALKSASEACFSIAEHVACVDRRVARLDKIEGAVAIDAEAVTFVNDHLRPAWQLIKGRIQSVSASEYEKDLPMADRILSPSDFGFHNGLVSSDGGLRFFDFEYAGWDDPAKLVSDFFSQPQIPVAEELWPVFVKGIAEESFDRIDRRARILFPAYQLKWCCIILNEFLRTDSARRDFAAGSTDATARKAVQLEKARAALARVTKTRS
jgi:hypothetical protein